MEPLLPVHALPCDSQGTLAKPKTSCLQKDVPRIYPTKLEINITFSSAFEQLTGHYPLA
jgi:hypothetical protein